MLVGVDIIIRVFVNNSYTNIYKYMENYQNSRCSYKSRVNSLITSFSLLVMRVDEMIQSFDDHVDTIQG